MTRTTEGRRRDPRVREKAQHGRVTVGMKNMAKISKSKRGMTRITIKAMNWAVLGATRRSTKTSTDTCV